MLNLFVTATSIEFPSTQICHTSYKPSNLFEPIVLLIKQLNNVRMQQVLNTLSLHFAIPCPLMVNLKITITTVPRNIASHLNIIPMKAGAGKKITHKKKNSGKLYP